MGKTRDTGFLTDCVFTDSSNNVGIGGAANASYKLAVTGATAVSDILSSIKTSDGIIQQIGGNATKSYLYQFTSGGLAGAVFNIGHNFYYDGTNYGQGNAAKSGWVLTSNLNADTFSISRAAAGSTSAPTTILSFASTGAATFIQNSSSNTDTYFFNNNTTAGNGHRLVFRTVDSGGVTELNAGGIRTVFNSRGTGTVDNDIIISTRGTDNIIVAKNNGNVGIGTSTATEGTQAAGSISIIPVSSVASAPLIQFPGNGRIRPASTGDRLSIDGNALFLNSTFGGNIIMATGGGNVLIGTTSNVGQRLRIYQPTSGNWNVKMIQPNGSDQLFTEFLTTTDGDATSTARGSIRYNGTNVLYLGTSDYRLKEDLKDYNALDIVSQLKTYNFKWKEAGTRDYGMMAHELQEVLPNYVTGQKDELNEDGSIKPQGVDYSKLVPIMAKAIQELSAKVTALENK